LRENAYEAEVRAEEQRITKVEGGKKSAVVPAILGLRSPHYETASVWAFCKALYRGSTRPVLVRCELIDLVNDVELERVFGKLKVFRFKELVVARKASKSRSLELTATLIDHVVALKPKRVGWQSKSTIDDKWGDKDTVFGSSFKAKTIVRSGLDPLRDSRIAEESTGDEDIDGRRFERPFVGNSMVVEFWDDGSFAVHRGGERRNHARMRGASYPATCRTRANSGVVGYQGPLIKTPVGYQRDRGWERWVQKTEPPPSPCELEYEPHYQQGIACHTSPLCNRKYVEERANSNRLKRQRLRHVREGLAGGDPSLTIAFWRLCWTGLSAASAIEAA
jgi:hypothetical protein